MLKKIKPEGLGLGLTLLLLAVPFTYMFLNTVCGVPFSRIHLAVGVMAGPLLVLLLICRERLLQAGKQVKWLLGVVGLFFGLSIVGQVMNFQSVLYYFSGLRNYGRYFVFFFACVAFLKAEERQKYMKVIDVIFWVNFLLTVYQFYVLGIKWDYLGGIFGVQIGCSSDTNLLLMIVISYSVISYMNQREKMWVCLLKCAAAMMVAAWAEIKVYFVEFVVILAFAVFMTRFTKKKMIFLLVCGACILVGFRMLVDLFPHWRNFFNIERIIRETTHASGYSEQGDLNRLTAAPVFWNEFLLTWGQKLFGLGLGNCDFGPVPAMTSEFYMEYYHLNYMLFSSGYVLLENGLVGMVVYLSIFVVMFFAAHSLEKHGADPVFCQLTKVLAPMCWLLFVYDCSLRTENGFFLYFALALAFVGAGAEIKKPDAAPGI